MDKLEKFVVGHSGVVSVAELAEALEVDEGAVRAFARRNDVRRLGATFAFDIAAAEACRDELVGDGEEDDEEEDEGEEADEEAEDEDAA